MADRPIPTNPTADIPTNWTNGQIVAPDGTSVGLTVKHGWNYIMGKINEALSGIGTLNSAWDNFKALAFKASAAASYTPAGTVSTPSVSVSLNTESIGSASGWNAGSAASISVASGVLTFSGGSVPALTVTSKTVATSVSSASASQPTFTGTQATITVN